MQWGKEVFCVGALPLYVHFLIGLSNGQVSLYHIGGREGRRQVCRGRAQDRKVV